MVLFACRRVDLQPKEIMVKVFLPYTQKLEYVKEFKQAHRRDDDIAIANAGMRVRFKQTAQGAVSLCPLFALQPNLSTIPWLSGQAVSVSFASPRGSVTI